MRLLRLPEHDVGGLCSGSVVSCSMAGDFLCLWELCKASNTVRK